MQYRNTTDIFYVVICQMQMNPLWCVMTTFPWILEKYFDNFQHIVTFRFILQATTSPNFSMPGMFSRHISSYTISVFQRTFRFLNEYFMGVSRKMWKSAGIVKVAISSLCFYDIVFSWEYGISQ